MPAHFLQKALVAISLGMLVACQGPGSKEEPPITRDREIDRLPEDQYLRWVATTGMIGDALENIGGKYARVYTMMGAGVDPHLYKPSPEDLSYLEKANFFCHNGLTLEGKLTDILKDSWGYRKTYAVVAGLGYKDLIEIDGFEDTHDPHIWHDLNLWSRAIDSLANVVGTEYSGIYEYLQGNSLRYRSELDKAHHWAVKVINDIPKEKRVLVTSHDAFRYFGRAYNIDVRSLQGTSTAGEFGVRDVTNLVNFLVENRIPAIFPESSISPKALKAVIQGCKKKGWDVALGPTLYGDALGEKGTEEGTHIGAFRHNVISIYEALSGQSYEAEKYE